MTDVKLLNKKVDLNHGDFEVLEISNNKEIYIEYKSDRKFLVFPHHTFMEEHFSKIMKTHNTFCIKMGDSLYSKKADSYRRHRALIFCQGMY